LRPTEKYITIGLNGGIPMTDESIEKAILNAEASLRMEGLRPSPEVLRECRLVLEGKLSYEEYIANVKKQFDETEGGEKLP
jgi:hypothetical protein